MKLINQTVYDTRAIRAAICAVHDRLARTEGRLPQWKHVRVVVVYARTRVTHGCAQLRGTYMKLVLQGPRRARSLRYASDGPMVCNDCGGADYVAQTSGRTKDGVTEPVYRHECADAKSAVTPRRLAALLDHEIRHLYGIEHSKMPGIYTRTMWELEHGAAAWANDHPAFPWTHLPVKAARKRTVQSPVERIGAKLAVLGEREKRWTTKLKRAQTALAKLRQAKRYQERRLAAFSQGSP